MMKLDNEKTVEIAQNFVNNLQSILSGFTLQRKEGLSKGEIAKFCRDQENAKDILQFLEERGNELQNIILYGEMYRDAIFSLTASQPNQELTVVSPPPTLPVLFMNKVEYSEAGECLLCFKIGAKVDVQ